MSEARAQAVDPAGPDTSVPELPRVVRPASTLLLPLTSVLIPGFGQLVQKRYTSGFSHAGAAAAGFVLFAESPPTEGGELPSMEDLLFDRNGARMRFYGLGVLYQGAGFLSAWDAFQASVPAFKEKGRFTFMGPRNSYKDLALAPVLPRHLLRPSTWAPLGALGLLSVYVVKEYRDYQSWKEPRTRWVPFTAGDAFFTGTLSLNAGATEEALFRGYILPVFHQWFGEMPWISNPAQALLFALAHKGTVDVPWVQGVVGLYLGWLTQRNGWSIAQSTCIHFWWDVIAVSATLAVRGEMPVSMGFSFPVEF